MYAKRLLYLCFFLLLTLLLVEVGFYLGVNANYFLPNFPLKKNQAIINNLENYSLFREPVKPAGTVYNPLAFQDDYNIQIATKAAEKGLLQNSTLSVSYRGNLSKFIKDQTVISKNGKEIKTYYIVLNNPQSNKSMTVGGGAMDELPDIKTYSSKSGLIPATVNDLKIGDLVQFQIDTDLVTGKVTKKELFILK